jgi:hypothetical protein
MTILRTSSATETFTPTLRSIEIRADTYRAPLNVLGSVKIAVDNIYTKNPRQLSMGMALMLSGVWIAGPALFTHMPYESKSI